MAVKKSQIFPPATPTLIDISIDINKTIAAAVKKTA